MRLKHFLIGFLVLIVAVLVAGYAVISSLDINQYRDEIIAQAEKATGRKVRIDGQMDLKVSLTPAIVLNDVGLANAAWGDAQEMMSVRRFELEVALLPLLSSQIQVKRLVIVEPTILLQTNEQGDGNWAFDLGEEKSVGSDSGSGGDGDIQASVDELLIEQGRLIFKDGQSGETLSLTLDLVRATAAGVDTPVGIEAAGSYQEVPFAVNGTLGSLAQLTNPDALKSLALKGSVGSAEYSVEGKVGQSASGPQADISMTFVANSLDDFAKLSGAELPPILDINISSKVVAEGQSLRLNDLQAKIGNSDLTGNLALTSGKTPKITGVLQSESIDLRDFTGPASKSEGAAEAVDNSPYVFKEEPFDLQALRTATMDVKLAVGSFVLDEKVALEQTQLALGLQDGKLTVTPLKTLFGGGQITVETLLNAAQKNPSFNLGFGAANIDYGRILREQGVYKKMQGTISSNLDLTGAGTSPRAIASSLNGKILIEGGEGVLDDKLLKVLTAGLGDLQNLFNKDESNKLYCILVDFDVENGLATSNAIVIASEVLTVSGAGTIDLRTEKLDLLFDTQTSQASLASLAIPFRVGGTLKNPKASPDVAGAAAALAKAAGVAINPVAGIGAIVGQQTSTSGGATGADVCKVAVEEAGTVQPSPTGGIQETITNAPKLLQDTLTGGASGGTTDGSSGGSNPVQGATEGLKKLFGN
ncbi:AsmA family protein [Limibacillus sp. MBR-115]|jgi:uncharacterized protein involved in outer membrane biogenesis|uniref:AsmA family protein n=1 Tax=Limibacillus sp. MBR-115 TaxID=3156465 RepID=UPI003396FB55